MAKKTKPRLPREKPTKPDARALIAQWEQGSESRTPASWQRFWDGLSEDERDRYIEDIDLDARYSDLVSEATPDEGVLDEIVREIEQGFQLWALRRIGELAVAFYIRKKTEDCAKAGRANAKRPRASRYAAKHPEWLAAATQAAHGLIGTKVSRQRKVTDALVKAAQGVSRRTLAAFVAKHWREIDGLRAKAAKQNLSIYRV